MKLKKQEIIVFADKYIEEHGYSEDIHNEGIAFFSKSKGIYTGVTRVYSEPSGNPTISYYGFYLDFANNEYRIDSASGNVLANTDSNLKKAFPSQRSMEGFGSHSASMLAVFMKMLGAANHNEEASGGRGIARALSYVYTEQFYKDFMINEEGIKEGRVPAYEQSSFYSKHRYLDSWGNMFLQFRSMAKRHLYLNDLPATGNLRKDLGLTKGNYKLLRNMSLESLESLFSRNSYGRHKLSTEVVARELIDKIRYHEKIANITDKLYEERPALLVDKDDVITSFDYMRDTVDALDEMVGGNLNMNRLVEYIVADIVTYQAFGSINNALRTLRDYYQMVSEYKGFVKFPKYLQVAHDIVARAYKATKNDRYDAEVASKYDKHKHLEGTFKIDGNEYTVLALRTPKEVVNQGQTAVNCVGGYVGRVASGSSFILGMQAKNDPSKVWLTLELNADGELVQAYQPYNAPIQNEQAKIINSWAKTVDLKIADRVTGFKVPTHVDVQRARIVTPNVEEWHVDKSYGEIKPTIDEEMEKMTKVTARL